MLTLVLLMTHGLLDILLSLPSGEVRTCVGRQRRRSGNDIGAINKVSRIVSNNGHLIESLRKR
jgi:hypothetical protein